MSRIRNSSYLRKNNLRVVLKEVLKHQPVSKSQVAKKLNVNSSTVSELLKPLINAKIILQSSHGPSSGGRPPILLRINPTAAYIVAVDLSSYSVRVALMNSLLKVQAMKVFTMDQDIYKGLEQLIKEISMSIEGLRDSRVLGICIAVSGVLNPTTGRISSSLIKGLENIRIGEYLQRNFRLPILVENDANLSALGEFMNMEEEIANMFYIHMGDGLGGGMVLEKSLFKGNRGYAGEIGKMVYNTEPLITAGEFYNELLKDYLDRGKFNEEKLIRFLATIVQNVLSTIDVYHFVVGGRYALFDESILHEVEKIVRERFYGFEIFIRKSVNNPDAILTGAAEYLMENRIFNI
ncbi:MAG: ROK family protein [Pseudothermotoga sp.]